MEHIAKKTSDLNTAIHTFFLAFKDKLVGFSTTQWKQEDLKGKSNSQWIAMQYYNLMYLLIIVHQEVMRTKDLGYPWSYYVSKFKLDTYKECLACDGIDFDKALEAFNIPFYFSEDGINLMGVQDSLFVTPTTYNTSETSFTTLVETPKACTNYIV